MHDPGDETTTTGLEELGNTDPVDSSSEDYRGPEATVEVEGDAPEEDTRRMLWEDGVSDLVLLEQFGEIAQTVYRLEDELGLTRKLEEKGVELGYVTIDVHPADSFAISLGLNLLGFFSKELAEVGKDVLKRLSSTTRAYQPNDEQLESFRSAMNEIQLEATAEMLGMTVEQFKEGLASFEAAQADADIEKRTGGEPILN